MWVWVWAACCHPAPPPPTNPPSPTSLATGPEPKAPCPCPCLDPPPQPRRLPATRNRHHTHLHRPQLRGRDAPIPEVHDLGAEGGVPAGQEVGGLQARSRAGGQAGRGGRTCVVERDGDEAGGGGPWRLGQASLAPTLARCSAGLQPVPPSMTAAAVDECGGGGTACLHAQPPTTQPDANRWCHTVA